MSNIKILSKQDTDEIIETSRWLIASYSKLMSTSEIAWVKQLMRNGYNSLCANGETCVVGNILRTLRTAKLLTENIAYDRNMVVATLLYELSASAVVKIDDVHHVFGDDVIYLINRLIKVSRLYNKQVAVRNENFQKLLLTFAEDIRVIIIMIIDRLGVMRSINHHPDAAFVRDTAMEARYLYAPLSHRLGLYSIKSELEDLSLKYLNRKVYVQIAQKLNETKKERDLYVSNFIIPIRNALEKAGMKFEIKGRTKTINSIWNKMKNKHVDLNGMYDLFAIRIILDTAPEDEKKECWVAYSLVTDIYTANPSRLRDWITIPKSNGYESLHTTVKGPGDKWVEVQIRTQRMDEIAERGLAAHWKYKGVKSEGNLDRWMNSAREILETGNEGHLELIRSMNMNLYDDEVFVFTPKGDLHRLPRGASVLDFAFAIHTRIGYTCVGARIDGKNQKLNYRLQNGDTVEILTSSTQMPRLDWLNYVVTSKARNKIKVAINESRMRQAEMGRELLLRRFKNRKINADDGIITRLLKPLGYKTLTDFYIAINDGKLDVSLVLDHYEKQFERQTDSPIQPRGTAEDFVLHNSTLSVDKTDNNVLVIGEDVKGINYKLSSCCKPIYGDKIVGFISSDGAVKIHRVGCGNIKHLMSKYPYRIIKSAWSGRIGPQFAASINVVGRDEIGIVSNISSVINKTNDSVLRNVIINSHDGMFDGHLVIGVSTLDVLDELINKISSLKGVTRVSRE